MTNQLQLCDTPAHLFGNGHALYATATAGEIRDGTAKDGSPRLVTYDAGAAVLVDVRDTIVAGPIDAHGAELLALAVVEGDTRAITEPGAILRLAIAYLALLDGAGALLGGKVHG